VTLAAVVGMVKTASARDAQSKALPTDDDQPLKVSPD